jgi:hypothetical protein
MEKINSIAQSHLDGLFDQIEMFERQAVILEDSIQKIKKLEKDKNRLDWLLNETTYLNGINTRADIDKGMKE